MSNLTCRVCGSTWDGIYQAKCPNCEKNAWLQTSDFLRPKHDPLQLPSAYPGFRSVVNPDYENDLDFIAHSGTALYAHDHKKYLKAVTMPSGLNAGSAIPSGSGMPTDARNSYLVVDTEGRSHIYADNEDNILSKNTAKIWETLPKCSVVDCDNLAYPNDDKCAKHKFPPLAD